MTGEILRGAVLDVGEPTSVAARDEWQNHDHSGPAISREKRHRIISSSRELMNDPAGHGHAGTVREGLGQVCAASNASAVTSGLPGPALGLRTADESTWFCNPLEMSGSRPIRALTNRER